jgi:hypothetical protein
VFPKGVFLEVNQEVFFLADMLCGDVEGDIPLWAREKETSRRR